MKLAVPRECRPGERRVAVTPENVAKLLKLGFRVAVEHDAGAAASFGDDDYAVAGAEIVTGSREIWQAGDIVLKVQPPAAHPVLGVHEAELIREGGTLDFLSHPAVLANRDPGFTVIDLICDLVEKAGDRASIVDLATIARETTAGRA